MKFSTLLSEKNCCAKNSRLSKPDRVNDSRFSVMVVLLHGLGFSVLYVIARLFEWRNEEEIKSFFLPRRFHATHAVNQEVESQNNEVKDSASCNVAAAESKLLLA